VARNDDRARARRAKRRGEDPSDAENAPEEVAETTPDGDEIVDAEIVNQPESGFDPDQDFTSEPDKEDDGEMSSLESEVLTHQQLTGSAVGFGGIETEADAEVSNFEPNAGGLVLGGEITKNDGGIRLFRFFKASWAELKRVRWPNRQQVAQGTAVTLGFVVIAGIYLGVADFIARKLVNFII
jgi:preprotein translocase SecE subunit